MSVTMSFWSMVLLLNGCVSLPARARTRVARLRHLALQRRRDLADRQLAVIVEIELIERARRQLIGRVIGGRELGVRQHAVAVLVGRVKLGIGGSVGDLGGNVGIGRSFRLGRGTSVSSRSGSLLGALGGSIRVGGSLRGGLGRNLGGRGSLFGGRGSGVGSRGGLRDGLGNDFSSRGSSLLGGLGSSVGSRSSSLRGIGSTVGRSGSARGSLGNNFGSRCSSLLGGLGNDGGDRGSSLRGGLGGIRSSVLGANAVRAREQSAETRRGEAVGTRRVRRRGKRMSAGMSVCVRSLTKQKQTRRVPRVLFRTNQPSN